MSIASSLGSLDTSMGSSPTRLLEFVCSSSVCLAWGTKVGSARWGVSVGLGPESIWSEPCWRLYKAMLRARGVDRARKYPSCAKGPFRSLLIVEALVVMLLVAGGGIRFMDDRDSNC